MQEDTKCSGTTHDRFHSRKAITRPTSNILRSGIHTARIDLLLPNPVASRLQKGFIDFGRKANGFLTNDAVLIGCETRTSSPVMISRHPENLRHIRLNGLFPCGEGAGYAGGIVSAAIDGERCADAVYQSLQCNAIDDNYLYLVLILTICF